MGFLSDIFGGIVSGIGAVFGIGKTIVQGVSSTLDSLGISSLVAVVGELTGGITSLVGGLAETVGTITKPILDIANSVKTLTDSIETNIIGPIIRPLADTVKSVETLEKTIGKLVDQGIGGIIEIPKALSDALGGIEANWDRATKVLAEAQAKLINESLVPGIDKAVAPGLQTMTAAFLAFSSPGDLHPDQLSPIHPVGDPYLSPLTELVKVFSKGAENPKEWYDYIFRAFYQLILVGLQLPAEFEPFIEEARARANESNPTKHLGPGDVAVLYQRKVLSDADAIRELSFTGYNEERSKGLLESTAWLPDPQRVIRWLLKGIVNRAEGEKILMANGLNEASISALIIESSADLPPNTLLDMLARGIIDQKTFDDQLRGQGYTSEQIVQLIKGGISAPSLSVAVASAANRSAGLNNWYADTYLSPPPADVVDAGEAGRYDDADVQRLWTAHFNALPIQTAIDLFFRGEMTRLELEVVVTQNNFPPRMTDLLIKAYSELITARSIPGLVERGDISPGEGLQRLQARGYSAEDANLLVDSAVNAAAAKSPTAQTDITKLTNSQLSNAYKLGVIDEDTYRGLLVTHGLAGNDAEIIIALDQYDIVKTAKKDEVDTLKAEVQLGTMTPDEAVQQLYNDGFSEPEVAKIQVTLAQTKRAAAKIPELGLMTRLAKKGLLSAADFQTGLQALGYAAPWDSLIVTLELGATDGTSGQPVTDPNAQPSS